MLLCIQHAAGDARCSKTELRKVASPVGRDPAGTEVCERLSRGGYLSGWDGQERRISTPVNEIWSPSTPPGYGHLEAMTHT